MGIEYAWKNWRFNRVLWARMMARAIEIHGVHDIAEMLVIDAATMESWSKNRYYRGFNYPSMTNFIAVCNLLDIDPRSCFELEE